MKLSLNYLILLLNLYNGNCLSDNKNGFCNKTFTSKVKNPVTKTRVIQVSYMRVCDDNKECTKLKDITSTFIEFENKIIEKTSISCCEGYNREIKNKIVTCVPKCDEICENGHCIESNVCKCDPGYHQTSTFKCEPRCDNCIQGTCTEPDVCECNTGYEKDSNDGCIPKCSITCVNGFCASPDTCQCKDGYEKDKNDSSLCNAIQTTMKVMNLTLFATPDGIICDDGYKKDLNDKCTPICEFCENGNCVKPGECKCNSGYIMKSNPDGNAGVCIPKCSLQCINANCTAPEFCKCNNGYIKNITNKYECYRNNTSKTTAKILDLTQSLKQEDPVCENGYKQDNSKCLPICDFCENGSCLKPGVCKCDPGYAVKSITIDDIQGEKCEPICAKSCENGYCSAPNVCTCNENYELNKTNSYTCHPICNPPCKNGECIRPQECKCKSGYYSNAESTCLPCNLSKCTKKDNCSVPKGCPCPPKTIYNAKNGKCEADCIGLCKHSRCENGKCNCLKGYYKYDKFSCKPLCNPSCLNGDCVAPNKCSCIPNYEKDQTMIHNCIPVCKKKCGDGGVCYEPDKCYCNYGYKLNSTHQCAPICKQNCENGFCFEPDICRCHKGYKISTENINLCIPIVNQHDRIKTKSISIPRISKPLKLIQKREDKMDTKSYPSNFPMTVIIFLSALGMLFLYGYSRKQRSKFKLLKSKSRIRSNY